MSRASPPRPPIAFRVGVVGHRPDRLPQDSAGLEAVRERLAQVLAAVAKAVETFADGPGALFYEPGARPKLAAISPLAEGADRLFAEEALRLGYQLSCVMPFAQSEFEQDFQGATAFDAEALPRFQSLLAHAKASGGLTRFELDGQRTQEQAAYEAAGRVVLNQSDLLVVVWDGGGPNGVGGTVHTLREAVEFRVPTLWIDSRAPTGWRLLREREDLECLKVGETCVAAAFPDRAGEDQRELETIIAAVVEAELGLDNTEPEAREHLAAYCAEKQASWNLAFLWKLFRDLLDKGVVRIPPLRVPDYVAQVRAEWPVKGDPVKGGPVKGDPSGAESGTDRDVTASWINAALRAHYAWSDKLAVRYADAHRSGYVWMSLLTTAAVFTALLPMAAHLEGAAKVITALVEACNLITMVALPFQWRLRRWHQRWLDYRVLAELVREQRILIPMGGGRPPPRTPAHLTGYGDSKRSWMSWQARAIARATGVPDIHVTEDYVRTRLAGLLDFVDTQISFHQMTCEQFERIHRRLHDMALGLFLITLLAVAANWGVSLGLPALAPRLDPWLILITAFLPAAGFALASINNQGEFARLQRRSHAMAEGLRQMRERMAALTDQGAAPSMAALTDLAAQTATMMVQENNDWRIVVIDLPHVAG